MLPLATFRFRRTGILRVRIVVAFPEGPGLEIPVSAIGEDRATWGPEVLEFRRSALLQDRFALRFRGAEWEFHLRVRAPHRLRLPSGRVVKLRPPSLVSPNLAAEDGSLRITRQRIAGAGEASWLAGDPELLPGALLTVYATVRAWEEVPYIGV